MLHIKVERMVYRENKRNGHTARKKKNITNNTQLF